MHWQGHHDGPARWSADFAPGALVRRKKEEKENEKRRPKYLKDVIAEQALKEARGDGSEEEDAAPESVRAKTYGADTGRAS